MDPRKAPFAIEDILNHYPAWPYSKWTTWALIRAGHLQAIRPPGRRVFVSVELLEAFLDESTKRTKKSSSKRTKVSPAVVSDKEVA
jgi:hypothetical protein